MKKILVLLLSLIILSIPVAGDSVLDTEYFGGEIESDYNYAPEIDETSVSPTDGSSVGTRSVTLEINISDPEGDEIEVTFYNNSDDSVIGTDSCAGNRTASTTWSGLSDNITYEWYIVVEECTHQGSEYDNISSVFNFTTAIITSFTETRYFGGEVESNCNYAPEIDETSVSPTDGSSGQGIPVMLEIGVSDPEGDEIEVTFYNNSDDSVIGTDTCAGNRTASTAWTGLSYLTTYEWYVVVEECTHQGSEYDNISSVFSFTTEQVYTITLSNTTKNYFCWHGDTGNLSDVADDVNGFDTKYEYIAVWNADNWTEDDGCWIKYYGDRNGTDAPINNLDIVMILLDNPPGEQSFEKSYTYTECDRTVNLTFTGSNGNKGYNYTSYCTGLDNVNLSTMADDIGLQTGEVISYWDNSTGEWRSWIENISHTDCDYTINAASPIFETKVRHNYSWVIE